jgi:hypothetical protein
VYPDLLSTPAAALSRAARFAALALCCAAFGAVAAEPGDDQRFETFLPHPSGIEITNGASGVVCLEGGEPSHVCERAHTIRIVGDAICEWSDEVDYPCTWYGYQFDVSNVEASMMIVCDVTNSIRTIFGPKTDEVTGTNTARYTIDLEVGQAHLFHPAYHTYAPVEKKTAVTSVHACIVDGAPLYQASFRALYEPE